MNFKRVLMLLLILALGFGIAACKTTTTTATTAGTTATTTSTTTTTTTTTTTATTVSLPQTLSILNGWTDGADGVHTITQTDAQLSVNYVKNNFSWGSMSHAITGSLALFNKLVFTVSGSGTLMVKIQGATSAIEVQIQLTAGPVTYQLNLRDEDEFLGGVTGVFLFGGPGKAQETGNFVMTKLEFDEGTAFGLVLEPGDNLIPQDEQVYDGTGETFDFSQGFVDSGDGVYTIDKTGTNPIADFNKNGFDWAYMKSIVRGTFSDFDYVVLVVKGLEGSAGNLIFKAELSGTVQKEIAGTFVDGVEKTVCLDLSTWTDEQLDALTMILVFVEGGNTTATGSIEIVDAYFSKVYVGDPIIEPETNEWDGRGTSFAANLNWQSNSGATFVVTYEGTVATVAYDKTTNDAWTTIKLPVLGDFSPLDHITFTVTGVAGTQLLIKINPSYEMWVDMTGVEQVIEYDLTGIPDAVLSTLEWVYLFPAANNATAVTGSLVISNTVFNYQRLFYETADPVVDFDINSGWLDDSGAVYEVSYAIDHTMVEYARLAAAGMAWSNIRSQISGTFSDFNYLVVEVEGAAGKQLLFKLEGSSGSSEKWVDLDGTKQTIVFDISAVSQAVLDHLSMFLIFAEAGANEASGSFMIYSAYFSNTAPETVVFENAFDGKGDKINTNLYWQSNTAGTAYTISYDAAVATILCAKTAGQQWSTIKLPVNGDFSVFENIEIVVTGPAGAQILFKIDPSHEKWVTTTGEQQTVIWDIMGIPAEVLSTLTYVYAFPGAHTDEAFAGSFVISSFKWNRAVLDYVTADPIVNFNVLPEFIDMYLEGFTISYDDANAMTLAYSRTTGAWALVRSLVSGPLSDFNYLVLTIQGPVGKQAILKVEGTGVGKDVWITFTGDVETIVLDITTLTIEQRNAISMVLIFAEPGVDAASGQFVVSECYFAVTAPEVVVFENAFDGKGTGIETNLYWTNNSTGMYTISYVGSVATVVVDKTAGNRWSTIKLPVNGDFSVFSSITLTVTGPVGMDIMFKINPSYEKWITCTGTEQIVVWDISGIPAATLEVLDFIYAFPGSHESADSAAVAGTFVITSVKWYRPVLTHETEVTPADLSLINYLSDEYLEGYTITSLEGAAINVAYARTSGEWTTIRAHVAGAFSDYDFLVLKVTGTLGKQVLIKVEGAGWNKELWVTLTGASQYAVVDLRTLTTEQLDTMNLVVIFGEPGVAVASGSFVVEEFFFSTVDPSYMMLDDFLYADEAAFEINWTNRTNASNVADPTTRLQLDDVNDTMVLTAMDPANGGWDLARRYSTLTALGVTNGYKYLAMYVTNNTNRTDKTAIWLYWTAGTGFSAGQNGYYITLPAIGTSGWIYVAFPYQAQYISDFAIGFDNYAISPVVGSLVVHKIVATQTIPA